MKIKRFEFNWELFKFAFSDLIFKQKIFLLNYLLFNNIFITPNF